MRTRLMLLPILALAMSVGGQPEKEPTESELEALVRQSPKTYYSKLIERNEQKLGRVLQAQLATADAELRAALENSQKKWREYYEAECLVGAIKNRGGSGSYASTAGRRLHLIRSRIHQLAVPYDAGWPETPRVPDPGNESAE